jgi:hypothetical protein
MCNDYGQHIPYSRYVEAFSQLKLPEDKWRFILAGPDWFCIAAKPRILGPNFLPPPHPL